MRARAAAARGVALRASALHTEPCRSTSIACWRLAQQLTPTRRLRFCRGSSMLNTAAGVATLVVIMLRGAWVIRLLDRPEVTVGARVTVAVAAAMAVTVTVGVAARVVGRQLTDHTTLGTQSVLAGE